MCHLLKHHNVWLCGLMSFHMMPLTSSENFIKIYQCVDSFFCANSLRFTSVLIDFFSWNVCSVFQTLLFQKQRNRFEKEKRAWQLIMLQASPNFKERISTDIFVKMRQINREVASISIPLRQHHIYQNWYHNIDSRRAPTIPIGTIDLTTLMMMLCILRSL